MRQDLPLYKIRLPLHIWRWLVSKGVEEVAKKLTEWYEESIKIEHQLDKIQITDVTANDEYWKDV